MQYTTLHIKNMVCNRCIRVVKEELEKLDLNVSEIVLGKVVVSPVPGNDKSEEIRSVLKENGFELIDDKKGEIIDAIKTLIIERIHHKDDILETVNSSGLISGEIGYDYSYLSRLFSSTEGITIEKYIINQKIEKAKELLVYNELSLKEISYMLGYSSVQHLSNQFKKVTGLSPTHFKTLNKNLRKPLDKV